MISPSEFRDLVSGRRRGVGAGVLRCGLRLVEGPYSWAVRYRNRRYDRLAAEITRVEVPVVSVGNLTLGGTGKTPMVEWIARWLRKRHVRVSLISRGYGARDGGRNDEALELEDKLPDVPHLLNPDRVAAARVAIEELDTQLILLDDAFQHRRIHRDLDIVLLDALEPFGFDHVFPRGTLREPVSGLARADVVLLSRADLLDDSAREAIRARAKRLAPQADWAEATHAPVELIAPGGIQEPIEQVRGTAVAAFCGIGNPGGFRHTLQTCGAQVVAWREFPDHHSYSSADVQALREWVVASGAKQVLCTHKDLVKLEMASLGNLPLRAVRIGLQFSVGQEHLEQRLQGLLPAATDE